jgi:hypothetical protein
LLGFAFLDFIDICKTVRVESGCCSGNSTKTKERN